MNNKRILLIDDEQDLVALFNIILKREGYTVDSFANSSQALSNYKPDYYDLVLLDIRMPDIDGFDLYAKIKDIDPSVKVYFLTASEFYYENFRKEEYKKLSRNLFIQKPIEMEELVGKVKEILG